MPDLDNGIDIDVGAVGKPEGTQPEHTEIVFILREKQIANQLSDLAYQVDSYIHSSPSPRTPVLRQRM